MKKPKQREKREPAFPLSDPPYAGDHAAMDFEVSRNGADSIVPGMESDVKTSGVERPAKNRKRERSRGT